MARGPAGHLVSWSAGQLLLLLLLLLFFYPSTQFPGNEKIALCNTKSTKIKLE